MKNKIFSLIGGLALIVGLAASPAAVAADTDAVNKALAGSTSLELPAKAASLVSQASPADKQKVAIAAVAAAVKSSPASMVAIVTAVVRANPSTAPAAAVTATILLPKQMNLAAKTAAAAAPSEAGKIVAALTKFFPQDYRSIAVAVSEGAPSAAREILAVVADAVPATKSGILKATAKSDAKVSVQDVLGQSNNTMAMTTGVTASPVIASVAPSAIAAPTAIAPTTPVATSAPKVSPSFIFTDPTQINTLITILESNTGTPGDSADFVSANGAIVAIAQGGSVVLDVPQTLVTSFLNSLSTEEIPRAYGSSGQ